MEDEGSSRLHDEGPGGVDNGDGDHDIVSKSRKVEKRRLHKQRQRASDHAKLESYEDLEARVEHMEPGTSMKTRPRHDEIRMGSYSARRS